MPNHHNPGVYPMYLTERILERTESTEKRKVTMYSTAPIKKGDTIKYRVPDRTFKVTEVNEERPAKGDHPKLGVLFYDLNLSY